MLFVVLGEMVGGNVDGTPMLYMFVVFVECVPTLGKILEVAEILVL